MALLITSINFAIRKVFSKNINAPMDKASSLTLSSALKKIIFVLLSICNINFDASTPLISGIRWSIKITLGFLENELNMDTASIPLLAIPATLKPLIVKSCS